jgi:Cu(I)/Ag(I) efflux system membrane fusion protein
MKRSRIVSLVIVCVLVVGAAVFHRRLIAWFTGEPMGGGAGTAVAQTAGPWKVSVALDPDPPREQGQEAHVAISDAAGKPVDGVDVEVTYDMPAMGAMAEMKSSFPGRPVGPGAYDAAFDLPMAGSWGLWVQAKTKDVCVVARYKLTVGQSGLLADGTSSCSGAEADKAIQIDEARQHEIGITTDRATRGPMTLDIRAVGKLTYDESRLTDVVLRVGGYVSDLRVRATGQPVKKGDPLFLLYSPDLFAAEQDYLVARSSRELIGSGGRGDGLVRAAEQKLALLGLSSAQMRQIADKGEPIEKLQFTAPASGSVIEKNVVDGDAVTAGQRVFRIAALDEIWVEADLYEADLARVKTGMAAQIAVGSGSSLEGKVTFVYPYLDPQTRTGRVRIALPNKGLELKPDMYATVTLQVPLGDRLTIPQSATVYAGPRRVVFVELGGGKLEPRDVTLGAQSGDRVEIVKGLVEGDVVVTSGNFLVSAESRLRGSL